IVGSDDNPYLRRLRRHRSSRNEEKPTQNQHDADHSRIDNGSATKRWRERKCKREERIGARELSKAQNPDPQNGQRGVENKRNEKNTLEQKAGDPLGERTIANPPQRRRFEQQLAASRGRCIGHERGNLAQRKTIAHRLGFRSTTRM